MFFRTFIVLFTLPIVAQADEDFSNYDVPHYTQIVDRIKAKVSARLGEGSKKPELAPGLKLLRYRNREFEAFTISWLPHDFLSNPHLCVFDGAGSRIVPERNNCPVSTGRNFTLAETIKLAVDAKNAVAMWVPY